MIVYYYDNSYVLFHHIEILICDLILTTLFHASIIKDGWIEEFAPSPALDGSCADDTRVALPPLSRKLSEEKEAAKGKAPSRRPSIFAETPPDHWSLYLQQVYDWSLYLQQVKPIVPESRPSDTETSTAADPAFSPSVFLASATSPHTSVSFPPSAAHNLQSFPPSEVAPSSTHKFVFSGPNNSSETWTFQPPSRP